MAASMSGVLQFCWITPSVTQDELAQRASQEIKAEKDGLPSAWKCNIF